jgi:hypothetical protein
MAGKEKNVGMLFGQRNRWRVSSICMIMSSLPGFSILAELNLSNHLKVLFTVSMSLNTHVNSLYFI